MQVKNIGRKRDKLGGMLRAFDSQWAVYERSYVFELMVIEKDARRFIIQAIQQDQTLYQLERLTGTVKSGNDINEIRR